MKQRNSLLRSRKPLRRKTWMRQRRAKPRRSGRVRDAGYLAEVRKLPCVLLWDAHAMGRAARTDGEQCEGPVEADHAGPRPMGRKCSDDEAIPLCRKHHRDRTDYTGLFTGVNAYYMRLWCTTAIAETRARLGRAA